jgi:hypothetical protein
MNMVANGRGTAFPPALQEALAWLGTPPENDALGDLGPLRTHLDALAKLSIPPLQYLKILELFQSRANPTGIAVKPLLLDATLPLPDRLRTVAQGLMDVYGLLAAGYLHAARNLAPSRLQAVNRSPAQLCAHGLSNLAQQYEVALLVSTASPPDLWRTANDLFRLVHLGLPMDGTLPVEAERADRTMKSILALSAVQPENFSPREIAFLAEYLRAQAACIDIHLPSARDDAFWLDPVRDQRPVAAVRRPPPGGAPVWHFSCTELSRTAREHLSLLADGERPEALGLPTTAISPDYRSALARAEATWAVPPRRQTNRRRNGYRVQVCTHLGPIWRQLRGTATGEQAEIELPASDWMILNESPSGYAIMHVAGALAGLVAGGALGLRASPDHPWHICLVRWARSDNPVHIELGIEVVAPHAEAVHMARSGSSGTGAPVPALLLPPLPGLRRGETLLTARGTFEPGRFTLIGETSSGIRVAECAAHQLSQHTACVELFEFERLTEPD